MNEDNMKHGAFGWNELMTTDDEGAKQFYTALFGWETEDMPLEGMEGMEGDEVHRHQGRRRSGRGIDGDASGMPGHATHLGCLRDG